MRTLLLLAVIVPAFLLAIPIQFFALLVYVWFALAAPLEWVWTDFTPLRLSLILGVLVSLPRERLFRQFVPSGAPAGSLRGYGVPDVVHPLSVGMLLFLATALVAQIGAPSQAVGWTWLEYLIKMLLVCLTAVSLLSTERRLRWMIVAMVGSIALNSAKLGVAFVLSGGTLRTDEGLTGAFGDNNGFALAMAMALPMMIAASQFSASWKVKLGWWGAAAASVLALVATFSRGGFLALVGVTLTFIALQRRRVLGFTALALVVALALLVVPIPKSYTERLSTIRTYEEVGETSAMSRIHLWAVAVDIVKAYPLGVGLFNYEVVYDRFDKTHGLYGHRRAVHSSHFQVLADQGYAGAVVWVLIFIAAFGIVFRVRARANAPGRSAESRQTLFSASNALIASMAGFLVGGSFLSAALNEVTWLTFATIAALDIVSARPVEQAIAEPRDAPADGSGTPTSGAERFRGSYRRSAPGRPLTVMRDGRA